MPSLLKKEPQTTGCVYEKYSFIIGMYVREWRGDIILENIYSEDTASIKLSESNSSGGRTDGHIG